MNIIHKVTWQCLKQNKRRTIVTLIGVIICTAMISALLSIGVAFQKGMLASAIKRDGTHEVRFPSLNQEEADKIRNHPDVAQSMRLTPGSFAKEEYTANKTRSYISFVNMDMEHMELSGFVLEQGKLPVKDNEILVDAYLYENGKDNYGVGKEVSLSMGNIEKDETGDSVFTETQRKKFVVTGVVNGGSLRNEFNASGTYIAYAPYQGSNEQTTAISFTMKDKTDFYETIGHLATSVGIENYQFNSMLLMADGSSDSGLLITLIQISMMIAIIIMIGGVSFVYNAFSISLSERSRLLGMLASVGATRKQKRSSVLFEAFVIGILAIPMGLVCGFVGIGITFLLLNTVASEVIADGFTFQLSINWIMVAGTVGFSSFILLLSALIPARSASKISCIRAIRQNKDIQIQHKSVKTSRLTRIIFGFEAELGLKNMKRNRQRYLATLFSLIVCFVLFLSANAFATIMKGAFYITKQDIQADVIVRVDPYITLGEGDTYQYKKTMRNIKMSDLSKLTKLPSASSSKTMLKGSTSTIEGKTKLAKQAIPVLQDMAKERGDEFDEKEEQIPIELFVLPDQDFVDYAKKAGADETAFSQTLPAAILQNKTTYQNGDTYTVVPWLDIQAGDLLSISATKSTEQDDGEIRVKALNFENGIKISHITEEKLGTETSLNTYYSVVLVMNQTNFLKLDATMEELGLDSIADSGQVYYESEDTNQLQDEIDQIVAKQDDVSIYVDNVQARNEQAKQMMLIVSTFLYGFVTLILLTCLANIINTISTSIGLRRREFAMLKSVGITNRKFKKMICYESIFYGIKATIYGIPLSMLCVFGMNQVLRRSINFAFSIPWMNILIAVAGVNILLLFTMLYAIRKVKNDNIVETIRNESM